MEIGRNRVNRCRYGWMLYSGVFRWVIPTSFELYREYSESEVSCLRRFVHAGDTVVDVGANIGDLTVPLAQMVGDAGSVYAFEANPGNFNYLCANLALNEIENVRPTNAFVARAGAVNPRFTGERWPVSRTAIDDLDLPACALIKIDVDGGEKAVLESADATIARHRPTLYFENDVREVSRDLLGHALGFGYDLYWHPAPIYNPQNFAGNPHCCWPENLMSAMVLGLPTERRSVVNGLKKITDPGEWWS